MNVKPFLLDHLKDVNRVGKTKFYAWKGRPSVQKFSYLPKRGSDREQFSLLHPANRTMSLEKSLAFW